MQLTLSGQVERFATIAPRTLLLRGEAGARISGVVRVIPEKKYPFRILEAAAKKGEHIRLELLPLEAPEGPGSLIRVENLKADAGRYNDLITLKTDSAIQPMIRIGVVGQIGDRDQTPQHAQPPLQRPVTERRWNPQQP